MEIERFKSNKSYEQMQNNSDKNVLSYPILSCQLVWSLSLSVSLKREFSVLFPWVIAFFVCTQLNRDGNILLKSSDNNEVQYFRPNLPLCFSSQGNLCQKALISLFTFQMLDLNIELECGILKHRTGVSSKTSQHLFIQYGSNMFKFSNTGRWQK